MADFITGSLSNLFPGGIDVPDHETCPPGKVWVQPECFAAPCPGMCVDLTPPHIALPDDEIKRLTGEASVVRIVHPFGEDPLDFVRVGAIVVAAWWLWKTYAKHNRR